MKKLYTLICAGLLISLASSAQTGGTYTAVMGGNWYTPSGPGIWAGAAPPSGASGTYCNNCLIQLNAPAGSTIVLNTQISLSGGSSLVISPGVTLQIQPSGGNSFSVGTTLGNYIVLNNDGNGVNGITLQGNARIDASSSSLSDFDGIFTAKPSGGVNNYTLTKLIGQTTGGNIYNNTFANNTPTANGPAVLGNTLGGPIFLSSTGGLSPLPIILSSFTATLDQDVVNLAWTTTKEVNADHMAVLRSGDAGAHWTTIGSVAATNNTNTPTNYSFADNKPLTGTSEYRLQLVDKDGKYTYSEIRVVRNGLITTASVFPNPAHNLLNVTLGAGANGNTVIRLFNQTGQMMQMRNLSNAAGTTVALSISGYAEGSYFLVVSGADGTNQVSKVLISK